MDLLFAPFRPRIVLVETGEVAVVALVQGLIADRFERRLADGVEDELAGTLGPDEDGGEGDVEFDAVIGKRLAAGLCLLDAEFGEVGIAPAGEEVLQVPVALAVRTRTRVPLISISSL